MFTFSFFDGHCTNRMYQSYHGEDWKSGLANTFFPHQNVPLVINSAFSNYMFGHTNNQ